MATMIIGYVYSQSRDLYSANFRYIESALSKLVSIHSNAKVMLVEVCNQVPLSSLHAFIALHNPSLLKLHFILTPEHLSQDFRTKLKQNLKNLRVNNIVL